MGLNELLVNNLRISTPSEPKPFPVSFGPQNDPTCSTLRVAGHTTGARADPGRAHNYSARLIRARALARIPPPALLKSRPGINPG
jgi:hypothetical protein